MSELIVKLVVPPDLTRALNANIRQLTERAAIPIAGEIKRVVAKYPPLSEANIPRGFNAAYSIKTHAAANRWYQRGYGPRWVRKSGGVGGRKTSEMLNRSWGIQGIPGGAILGSRASYSPYVHHYAEQAHFHRRRGWVTDKDAVDRVQRTGRMDRIMQQIVKRIMGGQ